MTEKTYPKVGSAAIISDPVRDAILLGKRGKEPNLARWVMPGGKIELFESIDAAAEREVREETGLFVKVMARIGIFEILDPPEHSVFVLSLTKVVGGELRAGDDLSEVRWVHRYDLPSIDLSAPCRAALITAGWMGDRP